MVLLAYGVPVPVLATAVIDPEPVTVVWTMAPDWALIPTTLMLDVGAELVLPETVITLVRVRKSCSNVRAHTCSGSDSPRARGRGGGGAIDDLNALPTARLVAILVVLGRVVVGNRDTLNVHDVRGIVECGVTAGPLHSTFRLARATTAPVT